MVLTVLLLAGGDRAVRHRELDVLVRTVEAGQAAAVYADRRLAGTVQYASGSLTSPAVPEAVRADLRRLVQREAAGQVGPLEAARDEVAGTPAVPWHGDVRRARRAALAHLDARLVHLRAVARDVRVLYAPRPAVTTSAAEARAALAAVVPAERAERLYG